MWNSNLESAVCTLTAAGFTQDKTALGIMRPAGGRLDTALAVELIESGVGVGLQDAGEFLQVLARAFTTPIECVAEQHRGELLAAGWSVVPNVHPQPPGLGLAAARFQDWNRCVGSVQLLGAENKAAERFGERIEQVEAAPTQSARVERSSSTPWRA